MQGRSLVVMAALVLVLGAFIVLFERDLPSTDERREQEKKVTTLAEADVTALEIEWPEGRVRLEKAAEPEATEEDEEEGDSSFATAKEWRLVEPLEGRADASAVDGLVTRLLDLEKERTLEDLAFADVGLDAPEARVRLEAGTESEELIFGMEVPASSSRMLGVEGRTDVYQVAGGLLTDLKKAPGDWRDKRLFGAKRSEVRQIRLSGAGPSDDLLLARRGEDFWIEAPFSDRVENDLANGLLNQLTGLSAEAFVDEPPSALGDWGLEPPRAVVEVVLEGKETPFRVELGDRLDEGSDRRWARVGTQLVELGTGMDEALDREAEAWRSRSLTGLQVYRVDGATVQDDSGEMRLRRADSEWLRGEDPIPYTTASDLLYALTDAKAEEVLVEDAAEAAAFGLTDEPSMSITLSSEEGEEAIRFHGEVDGRVAVRPEGRSVVLLVTSETMSTLRDAVKAVREAEAEAEGANADGVADESGDGPAT